MTAPANIFTGTGRRKSSTARVRIAEGSGKLVVNGRDFESYFSHENFAKQAYAPLLTVDLREKIDVTVNVAGGGVSGQAGAVAHGIARALQKMNSELRPASRRRATSSATRARRSARRPASPAPASASSSRSAEQQAYHFTYYRRHVLCGRRFFGT